MNGRTIATSALLWLGWGTAGCVGDEPGTVGDGKTGDIDETTGITEQEYADGVGQAACALTIDGSDEATLDALRLVDRR